MTPKLACADFTFPLLPHDKSLDLIAMLDFEGVDIGLFEGRSHLWPSRVFARPAGVGRRAVGQAPRPRARRSPTSSSRPPPTSPRSPPTIPMRPSGARRATGSRGPSSSPSSAAAGTSRRCRASTSTAFPKPNRTGAAATSWPGVARRPGRRASRFPSRRTSARSCRRPSPPPGSSESVPGLTLTLDYTHFTRSGIADARSGTPDRPRQPLPRPRRPPGPAPGIVQGKRHRLRTRPRRHAAGRLRRVRRR